MCAMRQGMRDVGCQDLNRALPRIGSDAGNIGVRSESRRGAMLGQLTCSRQVAQRNVHVAEPPESRLGRYVPRKDVSSQDGKVRLGGLRGHVSRTLQLVSRSEDPDTVFRPFGEWTNVIAS